MLILRVLSVEKLNKVTLQIITAQDIHIYTALIVVA